MKDYLSIANGLGMWLACSAIILVVIYQTIRIAVLAFRAGTRIGMPRKTMWAAFRTGVTTAIVPSIAILLGLAVLIPHLGVPFPWMRLAVIGSVTYELIAAKSAASEMGLKGLTGEFGTEAFTSAVWVMSLGVFWGLLFVAAAVPRIKRLKDRVAGGDEAWMGIMTLAAFFGACGYLVAQNMVSMGPSLIALVGGFFSMVLIGVVIKAAKQQWLKEWALALSIIGGMAAAGLAYAWFGIGAAS